MATNNDEFSEFENQLAELSPRGSSVDRATLMFRAGQESALSSRSRAASATWLWPLSTAALTLVSLSLSWQLYVQDEPTVIERVRIVEREKATETPIQPIDRRMVTHNQGSTADTTRQSSDTTQYLRFRELALATGMDAWSAPLSGESFESSAGASYREMRVTYTTLPSAVPTDRTPSEATTDELDLGDKS